MPIFAPYTGQRVQPIPSGYLAAEGQRAKMLQEGIASFGAAVEGWGRQKGEDALRQQKLEALLESLMVSGKQTSVINQEELAIAQALDQGTTKARDDKARAQYEIKKGEYVSQHQPGISWDEQHRAKTYDALDRAKSAARPYFLSDEGFFDFRNDVANEVADLTGQGLPLSLIQKNMGGRIDPTSGLPYTEEKLADLVGLALEANKQMDQSTVRHGLLEKKLAARDVDMGQLLEDFNATTAQPITTEVDYFNANQAEFTTLESEPAELNPRVLEVLGPKLLAKAKSGNMNRGDILVANEKLENLLLEQRAERSPEGRAKELQMKAMQAQFERGQRQDRQKVAWGDMIQQLGGIGNERRLASQTVTPELLMQQVQSGKMTAAEAIQREEAIVEHMRGKGLPRGDSFDFGDERGVSPYATGAELEALEERKKIPLGQDMLYDDAWKHNSAFKRKYGHLSPEEQAFKWHMGGEASKYTQNPDAPSISIQAHMDRSAPPQEMQQNFERALTGAESREQALALVDASVRQLGQAGHAAALAHVDRRFPAEITTQDIPGTDQVLIFRGGKMLGQATKPTALSTVAQPITGPGGNLTGDSITAGGKTVKTPESVMLQDPTYLKTLPEYVDVKGIEGFSYQGKARSKEEAVALRAKYETGMEVMPILEDLLLHTGMDDEVLAELTGRSTAAIKAERAGFKKKYGNDYAPGGQLEARGGLREHTDNQITVLVGKLRVAITGPGTMTETEVATIQSLLRNPYAYKNVWPGQGDRDQIVQQALLDARKVMTGSINAAAVAQGISRVTPAALPGAAPTLVQPGLPATQQPPKMSFSNEDIDAILKRRKK